MFKNPEISIWDLLVYLMSGGLFLVLITLHLINLGINVHPTLGGMSASTALVMFPFVSFMAFLSKFGFYRNAEFIFYINAVTCIILAFYLGCECFWVGIAFALGSLVCAIIFGDRAIDFYGHMTSTVYLNFIAANKELKTVKQDS